MRFCNIDKKKTRQYFFQNRGFMGGGAQNLQGRAGGAQHGFAALTHALHVNVYIYVYNIFKSLIGTKNFRTVYML